MVMEPRFPETLPTPYEISTRPPTQPPTQTLPTPYEISTQPPTQTFPETHSTQIFPETHSTQPPTQPSAQTLPETHHTQPSAQTLGENNQLKGKGSENRRFSEIESITKSIEARFKYFCVDTKKIDWVCPENSSIKELKNIIINVFNQK